MSERERERLHFNNLCRQRFGNLVEVRGDQYATIIDAAPKEIFVVIHIYDEVCAYSHMPCAHFHVES